MLPVNVLAVSVFPHYAEGWFPCPKLAWDAYVDKYGFEFHPFSPSEILDYWGVLPLLFDTVLEIKRMALCMLGKHSANEAAFPAQQSSSARKGWSIYSLIITDLTMRSCLCMAIYHQWYLFTSLALMMLNV